MNILYWPSHTCSHKVELDGMQFFNWYYFTPSCPPQHQYRTCPIKKLCTWEGKGQGVGRFEFSVLAPWWRSQESDRTKIWHRGRPTLYVQSCAAHRRQTTCDRKSSLIWVKKPIHYNHDNYIVLSALSQFYKYHFFSLAQTWVHSYAIYLPDEASGVHEFSTMNRQDGHLQFDPKRNTLRSDAHGQLRLEQAKLAIAPGMGGKQTFC
jgi:hypothetical protein